MFKIYDSTVNIINIYGKAHFWCLLNPWMSMSLVKKFGKLCEKV